MRIQRPCLESISELSSGRTVIVSEGDPMEHLECNRRSFLKCAALVGGAAAAGTLGLAGCAPAASSKAKDESSDSGTKTVDVVATYDCDLCVCGAGISGLSAAVQALQNGLSVVVLEKSGGTGGGGRGTEGVFAVGSDMQKERGIDVQPVEVVAREMNYHHNRVDGLRWLDLIHASGDNVAWLKENGVHFTGTVDNYHGGEFETFHWFGEDRAAKDYAPPMTEKARQLGAEILTNCPATQLIVEDGTVHGVYAQKFNGDQIQVNAQAVVLATGGFANNNEYLKKGHFSNVENVVRFLRGFDGDGLRMATEAGGADNLDRFSGLFQLTVSGAPGGEYGTFGSGDGLVVGTHSGNTIWVNETGERICAENAGDENWMALMTPSLTHESVYSLFDRAAYEENVKNIAFPAHSFDYSMSELDTRIKENPYGDAFAADTFEDLAKQVHAAFPDIEEKTLLSTIETYNASCKAGTDVIFGKPATYLKELATPPYYFIYMPQACMVTFGGIRTNRHFECVNEDNEPIPGLYAVGVDSADLWPNIYTINVPGGTNANNVNSGRAAANNAQAYIGQNVQGTVSSDGDTSASTPTNTWETPADLKDGTYTSTAAGMFGDITATVTVSGGKMSSITQENELETSYIGVIAMDETLIPAMIDQQVVGVDTVSGATASSNGLRNAVLDCLKQASV